MSTDNQKQGDWTETKAKIKSKWGKFTDSEIEGFKGHIDQLQSKLQKTYGYGSDQAERETAEFRATLASTTDASAKPAAGAATFAPKRKEEDSKLESGEV